MRVAVDARKVGDFGIGSYIRGLVGALSRARPDWTFVLVGVPPEDDLGDAGNVAWLEDRSSKYGVAELLQMSRHARDARADVFHAPHYVYPVRLSCPGVVTIHDCIHLRFPRQLPRPLGVLPRRLGLLYARAMMAHAGRAADRVIAVSEATARDLREMVGIPDERIEVIANGCDPKYLRDPLPEELAAADEVLSRGPAGERPFVLFAGNPKPHKNLDRLVAAVAALQGPEAPGLVLAGVDPEVAERVRRRAAPDLAATRLLAAGTVGSPALRGLYARARLLAAPSLCEGFGLPALEAMACGIPVVASTSGGLPEVVGDAGLLVDPADTGAIADAVRRLWDDERLRRDLGRRGRERASGFTWEEAARRTLAVYEGVAVAGDGSGGR